MIFQGKEFSFAVHNVPPQKDAGKVSLQHAKLECGPELRILLTGVEHVVQERLSQSLDLPTFVLELKDVLERIVRTQPVSSIPKPAFYASLCSSLDAMGWEHLAWLSPELTVVHLRLFAGREHIVQLDLPPGFPEDKANASADLPISVDLGQMQVSSLKDILSAYQSASLDNAAKVSQQVDKFLTLDCEHSVPVFTKYFDRLLCLHFSSFEMLNVIPKAVEKYQDFWTVMEDVDKRAWIIEPDHPSRGNSFRRIALGGHCSLSLLVDPLSPRSMPECRFFGSDAIISPLRKKLNSGFKRWDPQRLVVANLEDVLDLTFPSAQDTEQEDMSADCGICYAYRASDGAVAEDRDCKQGKVPDRVCNNSNCARPFHSTCLTEWLRSITTTRQSFDVLFGHCPYCSYPIAVKSAPG